MNEFDTNGIFIPHSAYGVVVQGPELRLVRGCEIFRHTYRERSEGGTEVGRKVINSFAPALVASFRLLSNRGAIGLMGFSADAIGN